MKQDEKSPPDMYDPTVRTTVDEVQGSIDNPGRLIENTGDVETAFELDRPLILIGNDPAADIIVENSKLADYIAEITYESEFYILRRLDDRCTVTVGSKPAKEYILADGDEIQLADRTFKYRAPTPSRQSEG
jgi:pSer/pThr/pTyr-binding forkhead associated (FHA) protein